MFQYLIHREEQANVLGIVPCQEINHIAAILVALGFPHTD